MKKEKREGEKLFLLWVSCAFNHFSLSLSKKEVLI